MIRHLCVFFGLALLVSCRPAETRVEAPKPSILLVTLDTTRFDAISPATTPSFLALAKRGRFFTQAYATVPQTLPSHTSMLTGLYPAGHGVHENARNLSLGQTAAERLKSAGYRTAAFVSAFTLARRFGIARGFDTYDDELTTERSARETTDRALQSLGSASQPAFLWVHYFEPHYPYEPPEPYRTRFAKNPYLGEVATMDEQLGRLVQAFTQKFGANVAILIVADHGESLGEHGEAQHGNLLYQGPMHVPLLLIGPGVTPGTDDHPVSTRRVFHTLLDFAGLGAENSLRSASSEVVLGEAMKPFLEYGWLPQVMAVEGHQKAILAGRAEVYDVVADPTEQHDLSSSTDLSRPVRAALRDYPIPSPGATAAANISDEDRRKLASLGYVSSVTKPVVRPNAPRPVDMAPLFELIDKASGLFTREEYAAAIPLLETILTSDPYNLDSALRLGTAHSMLHHDAQALAAYQKAQSIAPDNPDVQAYLALHYARTNDWQRAEPLLEKTLATTPDRLPALEALASIREREQRFDDAFTLRQRIATLRPPTASELSHLGDLAMQTGNTPAAIDAFEKARTLGESHDLELGVLYLASNRLTDARDTLDRIPPTHPAYPMALFKRAQVAVLLHEPDAPTRIARAREHADGTTRELIERERLFR